jgi:hypothetical protein
MNLQFLTKRLFLIVSLLVFSMGAVMGQGSKKTLSSKKGSNSGKGIFGFMKKGGSKDSPIGIQHPR